MRLLLLPDIFTTGKFLHRHVVTVFLFYCAEICFNFYISLWDKRVISSYENDRMEIVKSHNLFSLSIFGKAKVSNTP